MTAAESLAAEEIHYNSKARGKKTEQCCSSYERTPLRRWGVFGGELREPPSDESRKISSATGAILESLNLFPRDTALAHVARHRIHSHANFEQSMCQRWLLI